MNNPESGISFSADHFFERTNIIFKNWQEVIIYKFFSIYIEFTQ